MATQPCIIERMLSQHSAPVDKIFKYMSAGNHQHQAFKSHRLVGISGNVVTVEAEIYNFDGTISKTTIVHELHKPNDIETTMKGGHFSGAKFTHTYRPVGNKTKIDLEGDFPAFPGMPEADKLKMIDGFFTMVFNEDANSIKKRPQA